MKKYNYFHFFLIHIMKLKKCSFIMIDRHDRYSALDKYAADISDYGEVFYCQHTMWAILVNWDIATIFKF